MYFNNLCSACGIEYRVVSPGNGLIVNMSDAGGPTYASLTPANPTIINGLAGVDLQTGQQLATHQAVMNNTEHTMMNVVNTVGMAGPGMQTVTTQHLATVIPAVSHQQTVPDVKSEPMGELTASVDRNTLVAVLQFLKKNNMKVLMS